MRKAIACGLASVVVGIVVACGGTTVAECPSNPPELGACSIEGQTCAQPNLHCMNGVQSSLTCTNGTWLAPVDCHVTTGCGMFSTQQFTVDPNQCAPQLASATSCDGAVCSYTVKIPCTLSALDAGSEGGVFDAGDAGDGGIDCQKACAAAAPPNGSPSQFCQVTSAPDASGAYTISCGACGV